METQTPNKDFNNTPQPSAGFNGLFKFYAKYIRTEKARALEDEDIFATWGLEAGSSTAVETQQPTPTPTKRELVKIYLLSFQLPSRYINMRVVIKENKEIRRLSELSKRINTIRFMAYAKISRIFSYVPEFGTWIAVTPQAIDEARKVSEFVNKSLKAVGVNGREYKVRALPIYMEPEDAKALLNAAIKKLSADVSELRKKIDQAETERKKKQLRRKLAEIVPKLEELKEYLSKVEKEALA